MTKELRNEAHTAVPSDPEVVFGWQKKPLRAHHRKHLACKVRNLPQNAKIAQKYMTGELRCPYCAT